MVTSVVAIDGAPGVGKTTTILREAADWPADSAVVTYTRDAAGVLGQRAPHIQAGTVYSLTWPFVKPFSKGGHLGFKSGKVYQQRRIHHLMDPALDQYVNDAPSKQPRRLDSVLAEKLHAWDGGGEPPFDLRNVRASGEMKFILPLARWVEAGCPVPEEERLSVIAIDEAQDMGALEIAAALGLLQEEGRAYAYGDPGQAIFSQSKGVGEASLAPAFEMAEELEVMQGGYRVGDPVASLAAAVLQSFYERPSSAFRAEHRTVILPWNPEEKPRKGLVLAYSRAIVAKYFTLWNATRTAIKPSVAMGNDELVICTGHAAKGAEADDVFLLPWSKPGFEKFRRRDPAALRLMYVMLTRAKRRLHVPSHMLAYLRAYA
jgi:hypothetical protein